MSDLIERLEALEAPCREYDALIAAAVDARHGPDGGWSNGENGDYWTVDECALLYTASIDAAMMLVPEGHLLLVVNAGAMNPDEPIFGRATAIVGEWKNLNRIVPTEAATPAIALCIASLRAKEQSNG